MSNILSNKLKEDFYIRIYFNINDGFESAGIKRAYLDFNRTLKIKNNNQEFRNNKRAETEQFLKERLLKIISLSIKSQDAFDTVHENLCNELVKEWDELKIGQAQKWINMTLKYWLLFGESKIKDIEKNAMFFHIPIDSFVQMEMFNEKYPKPWSKIDKYADYFDYQLKHRKKETGNPPIVDEFEFFNNTLIAE